MKIIRTLIKLLLGILLFVPIAILSFAIIIGNETYELYIRFGLIERRE